MSDDEVRDAGFDEWLDAVEAGEAYYLACPEGHASLPPRRLCPECGADGLAERPLPGSGRIETVTVTYVATPAFDEDAPYATAIADFGQVRVTGQIVGVDPESVEQGTTVGLEVTTTETTGDRVVGLRPR